MSEKKGLTQWLDLIGEEARVMWKTSPDILLRLNLDGTIGQVNPAWQRWLGHTLGEVINQPLTRFIVADDLPLVSQAIQELRGHDLTQLTRFRMIAKDGREVYVGIRGTAFNGRGRSYLIIRTIYLILAYERLIEFERARGIIDFAELIEAAPDGIVVIDQHQIISIVNQRFEDIFGYTRQEVVGQALQMIIPIESRADHAEALKEYFGNPTQRLMGSGREVQGLHKDGSLIDIEIGLSGLQTRTGLRVIAVTREIGQRRTLERVVHQQRDQFEGLIQHSMIGVLLVNAQGQITYASPIAIAMLGGEAIEGQDITTLISPEHHPYWLTLFERILTEPDGRRRLVLRWHMKGVLYHSLITHLWHSETLGGVVVNLWEIERLGLP